MLFVESKIKKILKQPDHDVPLRKLAMELGCSLESTYDQNAKHFESIVVSRIREAARSRTKPHEAKENQEYTGLQSLRP